MEKPIDMVEYAKKVCGVTNAEHQALRDIRPCAKPKDYIAENLNEACNRRAQLALTTFEACLKAHLYEAEKRKQVMSDDGDPEVDIYYIVLGRIAMLQDLLDDIIVTKRGFQP